MEEITIPATGFSPETPMTDLNKFTYYNSVFQFGRADDNLSCGASGKKLLLTTPAIQKGFNVDAFPNSYPVINGKKTYVGWGNDCAYDTRHNLRFKTYYSERLNQNNPERFILSLPTNSDFQLTNSKGQYGDQQISRDTGFAIVPVFYKEAKLPTPLLKDVPFCALINVDGFSYNGSQDYPVKKTIPLPFRGEFFGSSPSMYDNLLSKVVSTQKVVFSGQTYPDHTEPNTRIYSYYPFCYIGADNPTLVYDDNSSRMALKQLHTAVRSGNGVFQEPLDKANEQASIESMCVNSSDSAICGTAFDGTNLQKVPYVNIYQTPFPFPVISSQSGVALEGIRYYEGDTAFYQDLTPYIPDLFTGTLFDKLGFVAEQLLPFTGGRQTQFNRSNYNSFIGNNVPFSKKYNNMVKPFTTNAYISGADSISMVKNVKDQQMENLGAVALNQGTYINAESDELIARNLPSKLDYPYLIVYSDIVRNTKFYGGANGQKKVTAKGGSLGKK